MTDNYFVKIAATVALFLCTAGASFAHNNTWQETSSANVATRGTRYPQPETYRVYHLSTDALSTVQAVSANKADQSQTIELPYPDGTFRTFRIWQTQVMHPDLADRYPEIKTFAAVAESDKAVHARIDYTPQGFHAMVFDGAKTFFIDPYSNTNDGFYLCYYKKDYKNISNEFVPCAVSDARENELNANRVNLTPSGNPKMQYKINGGTKRTYRLALSCTAEYSNKVTSGNPNKADVLAAMVTTMNRVNGVYEKEIGVTMQLVSNNDDLIFLAEPDPFTNNNGVAMQNQNQTTIDNIVGNANYDIGHVFSTAGGGIADLESVCDNSVKARGVTGQSNPVGDPFDLDYVAHEMGHQFGALHTFNAGSGSCSGNGDPTSAYEPGSGSTLMAYAGICGNANNLQSNTSAYFHGNSLEQMSDFLISSGSNCGSAAPSGNTPPGVPSIANFYSIPFLTPFELIAPEATDADHDVLTYCWEEFDLGDYAKDFNATTVGPIFRSFDPTTSRTRVFPRLDKLLDNVTSYLGEKLPAVARTLTFRLTVRDVYNGTGSFNFSDDAVVLDVINTGIPFKVNAPNTSADYWQIGSTVPVTWDVANTTAAPINCSNVDILLSLDNGQTFSTVLVSGTPNDGSENVVVPNTPTASARVKVKCSDNVFFDLSNDYFKINTWPASIPGSTWVEGVKCYPVPASDIVTISGGAGNYHVSVFNAVGQQVWDDAIGSAVQIPVSGWAKGVYNAQITNLTSNEKIVKKLIVQ